MQYPFVWLLGTSFFATLAAMPAARWIGAKAGLLDHPHERKLQTSAVPRAGGLGVLVGLTVGAALLFELAGSLGVPVTHEILAIFVCAAMIHVTGLLDDLFDLPAVLKLGAQALAVGVVIGHGVVLESVRIPGLGVWEFGPWAIPFTAFFLLGFVNAVNLVDGLDGLAAGIVAIGTLALAITGLVEGNYVLAGMASVLLGATLGFLPHNLRRQKTFLGDGGSMLLGFLMGTTIISGVRFSGTSTALFVGVACTAVPILDTATTIVRRARKGQRLFRADSMHIHHRMVRSGLSPRRTVLTILAVTLFAAGQALVFCIDGARLLVISTTAAAVLAGVQVVHRRPRSLAESDRSFREILFYLLGAQEGRGPLMDENMAMAEVIAAVDAARVAERTASVPRPSGVPAPEPVVPAAASRAAG